MLTLLATIFIVIIAYAIYDYVFTVSNGLYNLFREDKD